MNCRNCPLQQVVYEVWLPDYDIQARCKGEAAARVLGNLLGVKRAEHFVRVVRLELQGYVRGVVTRSIEVLQDYNSPHGEDAPRRLCPDLLLGQGDVDCLADVLDYLYADEEGSYMEMSESERAYWEGLGDDRGHIFLAVRRLTKLVTDHRKKGD